MRLIQCHIENFGKLSNQDFSFSDGVQCFCYENGWGKSTLAAFVTVMLYGFDKERSRDDYANERKRYRPWQGGVYGGSLVFEAGGRQYKVERTFGLKEKEDSFVLRDFGTNLSNNDFSHPLGEALFQLDRASFERTVFLSQNDCAVHITDFIQAKLGNLVELTDDIKNYEKADSRLNDILNNMSPARRTGSLYKLKDEISNLEEEVRKAGICEKEIGSLREEKSRLVQTYQEYKEIQESLHEEQKRISMNREERVDQPKKKILFGKSGVAAMVMILLGSILVFSYKYIGCITICLGIFTALSSFFYKSKIMSPNHTKEDSIFEESKEKNQRLEEIQQRLKKIQVMIESVYRKQVHVEQMIREKSKKREALLEKEEELVQLKEKYFSDSIKYERIKRTRNYLLEAKAAYLEKYRNPLMKAFSGYYEMISGEDSQDFRMNSNLELTVQDQGLQREGRYYSAGWRDLMGICMRMALIDVMFEEEKPFLIVDDPFVNLDGQKMEAALDFIEAVGKEYQILYFTCHESRSL